MLDTLSVLRAWRWWCGVLGQGAPQGTRGAGYSVLLARWRPDLTRRAGSCAGDLSGELFRFSTISMEWTMLDAGAGVTGTSPSARYYHAMAAVGTDIYLFGGVTGSGKGCDWWMWRGQTEGRAHAGWHGVGGGQ